MSIQTNQRYLAFEIDLADVVCDRLGIRLADQAATTLHRLGPSSFATVSLFR